MILNISKLIDPIYKFNILSVSWIVILEKLLTTK